MNGVNTLVITRMAELAAIRDGIDRTGFKSWTTQILAIITRDIDINPELMFKYMERARDIASVLRGCTPEERRLAQYDINVCETDCKRLVRNRKARERYAAKKAAGYVAPILVAAPVFGPGRVADYSPARFSAPVGEDPTVPE